MNTKTESTSIVTKQNQDIMNPTTQTYIITATRTAYVDIPVQASSYEEALALAVQAYEEHETTYIAPGGMEELDVKFGIELPNTLPN